MFKRRNSIRGTKALFGSKRSTKGDLLCPFPMLQESKASDYYVFDIQGFELEQKKENLSLGLWIKKCTYKWVHKLVFCAN